MNEQWQELKETIIEMRDNDGTLTQQEVCKFLANLMDVLEKQMSSSENPNKWIPVSERLPEKEEIVLITIDSSYYPRPYVDMGFYKVETKKWYWFNAKRINHSIKVTGWLPLPEPYRESEEIK